MHGGVSVNNHIELGLAHTHSFVVSQFSKVKKTFTSYTENIDLKVIFERIIWKWYEGRNQDNKSMIMCKDETDRDILASSAFEQGLHFNWSESKTKQKKYISNKRGENNTLVIDMTSISWEGGGANIFRRKEMKKDEITNKMKGGGREQNQEGKRKRHIMQGT